MMCLGGWKLIASNSAQEILVMLPVKITNAIFYGFVLEFHINFDSPTSTARRLSRLLLS